MGRYLLSTCCWAQGGQFLPCITHTAQLPRNNVRLSKNVRIYNSLYRFNVFHKLINCCWYLLDERVKRCMFFAIHASDRNIWFWWGLSVCFSFFVCVWENVEEGASAYFSAWLSIWLPICLLFYLLPAETQHTFCGEICKPRRPAQQMLFRKDDILPVSSHTLFCAFETGTTTNMKASGNMPLTFQQPPFSWCVLENHSTDSSRPHCQWLHWNQSMEWSESHVFLRHQNPSNDLSEISAWISRRWIAVCRQCWLCRASLTFGLASPTTGTPKGKH